MTALVRPADGSGLQRGTGFGAGTSLVLSMMVTGALSSVVDFQPITLYLMILVGF